MKLLLLSLASLALAAPTTRHVVHERRSETPNWVKLDRVRGDVKMPMRIGLNQQNLHRIDELLMDVSHPDSPNYGNHYSQEDIVELFAPHEDTVQAVRDWLHSAGLDPESISHSANKQWIQFDATVWEAEELLRTKYHMYEHKLGKMTMGCDDYSVPDHIAEHIDYITPGIKLFANEARNPSKSEIEKRTFKLKKGTPGLPPLTAPLPLPLDTILALPLDQLCSVAITPPCIMTMYNISAATSAVTGNELGIFEDLGDYYSQTDLNEFFLTLYNTIPAGTHPTLHGIDGAVAPTTDLLDAGPESDLDFQISYPLIYPQNSILFQTDDTPTEANYTYEGFLNNFLDGIDGSYCTYSAFGETGNSKLDPPYPDPKAGGYKKKLQCGAYSPTNVISISYGGQEADLPVSYQKRQCNEFAKLGMQGHSIVLASGDSGVAGPAGDDSADGCLLGGKVFSPDFPATCPYLTTAGSTFLPPGADVNTDSETSTTRFPSGGGFSNIYPAPSYQKKAVATYFQTKDPAYKFYSTTDAKNVGANGGIYNRIGRGYPDVSAIGDNIIIFNAGAPTIIGGTSAAAPTFASILTRINDERLKAGKKTIGFVNPTLYANPTILHDITVGNNSGCGTAGFYAAKGWDPVSGLGTPDYPKMLSVFMALK